nr:MAG: hypothetical protein 3 [Leviviridae sp.]
MRNRYKLSKFFSKEKNPSFKDGNIHWELLTSLLQGYGRVYGENELFHRLGKIISERDVAAYLALDPFLIFGSQLYSRSQWRHFRDVYQLCAFLRKFPFPHSAYPIDRREVAKATLLRCEEKCRETNERLGRETYRSIARMSRTIRGVLGDLTPDLVMKIIRLGKHGPGSTLSSNGNRVTPYYKYVDFPYTVTPAAFTYAATAISSSTRWMELAESSGLRVEYHPGSGMQSYNEFLLLKDCHKVVNTDRITFVPKDARTDRPIAVGASMNLYLQLGVKAYMQERLMSVGVDLTDQSKNQCLAQVGSKFWGDEGYPSPNQFITIDLSSASDSISRVLVEKLLDPLWYGLLDDFRHKSGVIDGAELSYEKFCAMGNGYTFPLESLIFYAAVKAAVEEDGYQLEQGDFAVYGDDIIIRRRHLVTLQRILDECGFSINSAKSFTEGPFKESCGADFLHGNNVRPFYLKREVKSHEDLYFVCNSVAHMCISDRGSAILRELYSRSLRYLGTSYHVTPLGGDVEGGIQAPLSALVGTGLSPYLTRAEKLSLYHQGHLSKEALGSNLPICVEVAYVPRRYGGKGLGLLHTYIEGRKDGGPTGQYDSRPIVGSYTTRRNAGSRCVSVREVPNWDFPYVGKVSAHPFYWVD